MSNPYPTLYTISATPQVILGSTNTGLGADNALLGFRKYNSHTHLYAASTNFYTYGVSIGDAVYVYDEDGAPLFSEEEPPVVEYISPEQLRISVTSNRSLDNRTLIVKRLPDSQESIVVIGVSLQVGSSLISLSRDIPRYGHVDHSLLSKALKSQLSRSYNLINATSGTVIPIAVFTEHGWLETSTLLSIDAAVTLKFQIKQFQSDYSLPPTTHLSEVLSINSGETLDYQYVEHDIDSEDSVFSSMLDKSLQAPFILEVLIESITKGTSPFLVVNTYFSKRLERIH